MTADSPTLDSPASTRKAVNAPAVVAGCLLMLALLVAVDIRTGPAIPLGFLYLIPLGLAAWFAGRWGGIVLALACTGGWLIAQIKGGRTHGLDGLTVYGNASARVVFLALCALMVSTWRSMGQRLEAKVNQRTLELQTEVTERRHAEEELRKYALKLSEAEDTERRKIAHEIHDALGQTLSVLKMKVESISLDLGQGPDYDRICEILPMIDGLIRQTRTLTFDLYPAMLDDLGLVPTLRRYAEQFGAQTRLLVNVEEAGNPADLPRPLKNYLFRAMKELLNNAAKHGGATEIVVSVHWRAPGLRIVIDDNGRGFNGGEQPAFEPARGLGLPGIRQRLKSFGGQMHVESQAGEGARVILEIHDIQLPLEAAETTA